MTKERLGVLFILVGPGGVGKNALMNEALKQVDGLQQLPTATTRPQRAYEQEGREHQFVSQEVFQRMIVNNELLEYQEVHPGKYYGVPRITVDKAIEEQRDLIADIEVFGAEIIQMNYPENSVSLFIAPPSLDVIADRLKTRSASAEDIQDRLNRLPMEMLYAPLCDYLIVNDKAEAAVEELISIVQLERGYDDYEHAYGQLLNEVSFQVNVLPLYQQEALCASDKKLHDSIVQQGNRPADVALRIVEKLFEISPPVSAMEYRMLNHSMPLTVHYSPDQKTYQITYYYLCHLDQRLPAPDGWQWQSLDMVNGR